MDPVLCPTGRGNKDAVIILGDSGSLSFSLSGRIVLVKGDQHVNFFVVAIYDDLVGEGWRMLADSAGDRGEIIDQKVSEDDPCHRLFQLFLANA